MLRIRLFLFLSLSVLHGFSQNAYRFRNYTINDGLSQSAVTAIVQDEFGALWIGTQDGLNRFDGQTFENFTSDNTKGLESEYITCALKAKSGLLWFGTANGLTCYNPYKETFTAYQRSDKFSLQVENLTEDNAGNIWFGTTTNGLFYLPKNGKTILPCAAKLPSQKIHFVSFFSDQEMFVSTEDKGLYMLNLRTNRFRPIEIRGKKGAFVRVNVIRAFEGGQWLVGTNQGLYILDKKALLAKPFVHELDKEYELRDVSDILVESGSAFFLTTKSQGLFSVIERNDEIQIHQSTQDIFQKNALLYNALNGLFKDKNGTFWVGTERGLGSFDPLNKGFLGVGPSGDLSKGIPSPSVWCFGEDPLARYLFVGTDNAISRLDKETGKFEQFLRNGVNGFNTELNESTILSCYVIDENTLLIGATDGLYTLKTGRGKGNYSFQKIHYKGIANPSNFERTYRIVRWRDQKYFIATKGGVLLYDHANGNFRIFEHNPQDPGNTIGAGVCRFVYKDLKGKMWFSTSAGGLCQLKEGKDLKIVPSRYNKIISRLSRDYITTILQTSDKVYWLGTMGSGIIRMDVNKHKGKIYNKKHGLPNNVVYGILDDGMGYLWLSTNKGLSKFDCNLEKAMNFTEVDGLMSNEFNQGAYMRSHLGDFYFGGIYGYNYFNPRELDNVEQSIEVSFMKLKIESQWLRPGDAHGVLKTTIAQTPRIELEYNQRSFTVKFMALDLSNPDLINYKYILEGSNEGEIMLGTSNQLHFNSLQPGEYVLKVYARLGNGAWSTLPATMEIEVASPFWRTAWFWAIIIALIGAAIYYFIRKKIEYERRQQVRLEMKITERTREIREQNIKIEKQKKVIEEKKDNLEEQKKLLEIEKEKTEKLLKNIIPESTYEELKKTGRASARGYKTVSVLFTDFVGFTKIAEKMKPAELVNELDIYFRKFDEIVVRNNLEKIKTIGDAYMCAGGVPVRNNTNPIDACLAALQIQESMVVMREEAMKSSREVWDLRLGINTGEVTAGVIGSEKLAYDIWGSTVNKAQRMEMLGEPGKVTISGETFKFIEPYFECTFRGKAKAKSQGFMDMYTVDRIKPELSVDGNGLYPNERFHQIVNLHFYSSINYYKAERHIMKILERKLSPKLHYHSIEHTKDVCKAIERLALLEGVTDEGLFLLKSAATYHDAGFVESYEKNEPVGARMAEEILPGYGYSEQHIDQIKKLIFVTQIPHNPQSKLEEIICDADLDYLGRDDFHEIADRLRLELREHGKIDSDRKWDEIQVMFLSQHRYFTDTAKNSRDAKKAQNLEEIKEKLRSYNYKD